MMCVWCLVGVPILWCEVDRCSGGAKQVRLIKGREGFQ